MTRTVAEFVRYGVKGAGATVANVVLMSVLVELRSIRPAEAALLSTSLLLVFGYAIMNRWVFGDEDSPSGVRGHLRRGAGYYAVILSGKAVNYALFAVLLGVGVWYPAAWIIGSGTVFLGTFTANRWLWHGGAVA